MPSNMWSVEDSDLKEMVRATDREIFEEAVGAETTLDNDDIEEFAQGEGWNGDPIGPEESAAVNIEGFPDTGQDRPLQYEREVGLETEIRQRDEQIAAMQARMAELEQRADPQLQARQAAAREDMIVQLIADPDGALRLLHAQQQHIVGMHHGRADAAMMAAHRKYGKDFEDAHEAMTSLDPRNPVAQQIVNGILADPNPGEAVMTWYDATGGRPQPPHMGGSGGPRVRLPSLNNAAGGGRGGGNWNENSTGGFLGDEADIFASAFK